jgi:HEAT repeat protein
LTAALLLPAGPVAGNGWEHGAIPFDALLRALAFEQPETRRRAAESLGFRGQREGVEPLLQRLAQPEPDPGTRSAIYLALGRLGDARAAAALTRCLDTETREELRSDCTTALGLIGDVHTLPRLLRALQEERSFLVRSRAVDALGSFSASTAVAALAALAREERASHLRLRAIRSLGRTHATSAAEPLLAALAAARDDGERAAVVAALGELKTREATKPLTALLVATHDPELRVRIAMALGAIRDNDAMPSLIALLADDSPAVRYFAVEGLRTLGRPEAATPLLRLSLEVGRRSTARPTASMLADLLPTLGDLSLQEATLRALIELDAPTGLEAFLAVAQGREVPRDSSEGLRLAEAVFEVRRIALVGLGYTRAPRAATSLAGRAGLGDPDFRLRAAAVRSLGVLGFPDASGRVSAALGDSASEVRWTAAMVLGRLGRRSAVDPLIGRLSDPHAEVRRQAALSLGYLGDRRAQAALRTLARDDERESVREAAAYAARLLER